MSCLTVFEQIYCGDQVIYTPSAGEDILLRQSQCTALEVPLVKGVSVDNKARMVGYKII